MKDRRRRNKIVNLVDKFQNISSAQNSIFKKRRLDAESWDRFDKMYQNGKIRQRERSKPKSPEYSFIPHINDSSRQLKREKTISDILYQDALRKQDLNKKRTEQSNPRKSNSKKRTQSK